MEKKTATPHRVWYIQKLMQVGTIVNNFKSNTIRSINENLEKSAKRGEESLFISCAFNEIEEFHPIMRDAVKEIIEEYKQAGFIVNWVFGDAGDRAEIEISWREK